MQHLRNPGRDWSQRLQNLRESPGPAFRRAWDGLKNVPGGKRLFSRLVGTLAPYSGTICPQVQELRSGHGRVRMPFQRRALNHIGCVHAAALFNLAEFTAITTLAYSVPDQARFIVAGMDMQYLKKGRGDVFGVCECPPIVSAERREYPIPVRLEDAAGAVIARVNLRALVGPRRP